MVQHSVTDIFRLTTTDVHPPLYYVLLRFTTRLFGDSVFALRLPSVVAATALVALGAGPVRRLWNDKTAWVYVALVLTSSGILCFAQEIRMYALAALCVTGAALYGHLAWRDGARRDYVAFGLFTWAASLTHYFALVAVGFNAVLLLAMAAFGSRERLKPLATTTGLAAVGFLPWAPFFFSQVASVARGFWIPPTSFEIVTFGLVAPFAYKFEDVPYPWQAIAALAGFAFVVRAALVAQRREGVKTAASLHFLAVFGSTLGFGLLFSALVQPIFMPRYMIACSGVIFLVLAAAIAHCPPGQRSRQRHCSPYSAFRRGGVFKPKPSTVHLRSWHTRCVLKEDQCSFTTRFRFLLRWTPRSTLCPKSVTWSSSHR